MVFLKMSCKLGEMGTSNIQWHKKNTQQYRENFSKRYIILLFFYLREIFVYQTIKSLLLVTSLSIIIFHNANNSLINCSIYIDHLTNYNEISNASIHFNIIIIDLSLNFIIYFKYH